MLGCRPSNERTPLLVTRGYALPRPSSLPKPVSFPGTMGKAALPLVCLDTLSTVVGHRQYPGRQRRKPFGQQLVVQRAKEGIGVGQLPTYRTPVAVHRDGIRDPA